MPNPNEIDCSYIVSGIHGSQENIDTKYKGKIHLLDFYVALVYLV